MEWQVPRPADLEALLELLRADRDLLGDPQAMSREERLVLILYYYEELTMKEIGTTLGLSESRVSQMHSSIVSRLKEQLGMRRPEFD